MVGTDKSVCIISCPGFILTNPHFLTDDVQVYIYV